MFIIITFVMTITLGMIVWLISDLLGYYIKTWLWIPIIMISGIFTLFMKIGYVYEEGVFISNLYNVRVRHIMTDTQYVDVDSGMGIHTCSVPTLPIDLDVMYKINYTIIILPRYINEITDCRIESLEKYEIPEYRNR